MLQMAGANVKMLKRLVPVVFVQDLHLRRANEEGATLDLHDSIGAQDKMHFPERARNKTRSKIVQFNQYSLSREGTSV